MWVVIGLSSLVAAFVRRRNRRKTGLTGQE
ncbi:hypothetical protein GZL_p00209 (plasmid) [Streptomyces sp. 769]|nr:hypothetical protein GZL_p00209 [Streptomyces sp. 769]